MALHEQTVGVKDKLAAEAADTAPAGLQTPIRRDNEGFLPLGAQERAFTPFLPGLTRGEGSIPQRVLAELARRPDRINFDSPEIQATIRSANEFRRETVITQEHNDPHGNGAIGLGPEPFRCVNLERFPFLFLHDANTMDQPDMRTPQGRQLVRNSIKHFAHLFKGDGEPTDGYGIIPNFNNFSALATSGPPFFASMTMDVWRASPPEEQDKGWLRNYIDVAKEEFTQVWDNPKDRTGEIGTYHHFPTNIPEGDPLRNMQHIRVWGDRDGGYAVNRARESGVDFSRERFKGMEDHIVPNDLNFHLIKTKLEIAQAEELLGDHREAAVWRNSAMEHVQELNALCWDSDKGYHFDYLIGDGEEYQSKRLDTFTLFSGVYALWSGAVDAEQVMSIQRNLRRFNRGHGFQTTDPNDVLPNIPDNALARAGIDDPDLRRMTRENLKPGQWDGTIWSTLLMALERGQENYIFAPDSPLNADQKAQLLQELIEEKEQNVQTLAQMAKANEWNLPEAWKTVVVDGQVSHAVPHNEGKYHYRRQDKGVGWTYAHFVEDVTTLQELYQFIDGSQEADADSGYDQPQWGSPVQMDVYVST